MPSRTTFSTGCSGVARFGFARIGMTFSEEQDVGNVKVDSELIDKDGKITRIIYDINDQ